MKSTRRAFARTLPILRRVVVGATVVMVVAFLGLMLVPRMLGWHGVVVLSGSMEPALPLGGVAFTAPTGPEEIETGDVITFHHPDGGAVDVTHRVVRVVRDGGALSFRTKGDANDEVDTWVVEPAALVGRVHLDLPYVGYLVDRLQTPSGFAIFFGLPAIVVVTSEARNIARQLRERRRAKRVRQPVGISVLGDLAGRYQVAMASGARDPVGRVGRELGVPSSTVYESLRQAREDGLLPRAARPLRAARG
jgi:signal peptidase